MLYVPPDRHLRALCEHSGLWHSKFKFAESCLTSDLTLFVWWKIKNYIQFRLPLEIQNPGANLCEAVLYVPPDRHLRALCEHSGLWHSKFKFAESCLTSHGQMWELPLGLNMSAALQFLPKPTSLVEKYNFVFWGFKGAENRKSTKNTNLFFLSCKQYVSPINLVNQLDCHYLLYARWRHKK